MGLFDRRKKRKPIEVPRKAEKIQREPIPQREPEAEEKNPEPEDDIIRGYPLEELFPEAEPMNNDAVIRPEEAEQDEEEEYNEDDEYGDEDEDEEIVIEQKPLSPENERAAEFLQKTPSFVGKNDGVIEMEDIEDYELKENEMFFIKKKLGRFPEIIIDVLEYAPTREDIEDNYLDMFGGGKYKVFAGEKPSKVRKVRIYRIDGNSITMEFDKAKEYENKAIEKYKRMKKEMEGDEDEEQQESIKQPQQPTYGGIGLPRTPEEMAFFFVNTEKDHLQSKIESLEKENKDMERTYQQRINELKEEIDRLREDIHKKDLEIVKMGKGGDLKEQIKDIQETTKLLGLGRPNNVWLDVLNSPTGTKLVEEADKLVDTIQKRWETKEWENKIKLLKEKRKEASNRELTVPKSKPKKQINKKDYKLALMKKLAELLEKSGADVPQDVIELAIDTSLEYTDDAYKKPKTVLKRAVLVIQSIQEVQDAAAAIDSMILTGQKTPKEAADWLIKYQFEKAQKLAISDYDELLQKVEPYAKKNKRVAVLVEYFEQPEVKKVVDEIISELKKNFLLEEQPEDVKEEEEEQEDTERTVEQKDAEDIFAEDAEQEEGE